jgi:transcriptional antiterminator RfaH
MKHWYTIYTKSRQEVSAAENLQRQAFEVYLPNIKQGHRYRGQWREKIEPLFPRYLFIRLNLGEDNIAPIRSTYGVSKLVSFSGLPTTVPGTFIDALTQRSDPDTGLLCPEKDLFEAGVAVTIMDGPLQGLEAIFKIHDGEQRSFILLELLGKIQQISIDRDHLVPGQSG